MCETCEFANAHAHFLVLNMPTTLKVEDSSLTIGAIKDHNLVSSEESRQKFSLKLRRALAGCTSTVRRGSENNLKFYPALRDTLQLPLILSQCRTHILKSRGRNARSRWSRVASAVRFTCSKYHLGLTLSDMKHLHARQRAAIGARHNGPGLSD